MATTTNYNHFRSGLENRLSSSLSTYPLSSSSDLHMKHNFEYSWKHFFYHVTNFLSQATALPGSVAQGSPLKCVALPLMARQSHETGKLFPCQAKDCQTKDCQTKAAPLLAPDSRCRRPPGALRIWPQNVFLLSFPPGGQLFLLTALRSRSLFVLASLPAKSINPLHYNPLTNCHLTDQPPPKLSHLPLCLPFHRNLFDPIPKAVGVLGDECTSIH